VSGNTTAKKKTKKKKTQNLHSMTHFAQTAIRTLQQGVLELESERAHSSALQKDIVDLQSRVRVAASFRVFTYIHVSPA
jgi:hypothetical protein